MKNIFITAPRGYGKTTALKKTIGLIDKQVSGFEVGKKFMTDSKEFYICDIENTSYNCLIAYSKSNSKPVANIEGFENHGCEILKKAISSENIIIMDEIGFLEENAPKFKQSVIDSLNSSNIVIGVLKKFNGEFINYIKSRDDVLVLELTLENRDDIPNQILKHIRRFECNEI
ncbi:nucleoside-triphosphatase [Tepidibacter sp. Z1-5]|uniref:nucleoside-triphosphatase n=1 Tax=Tepidibacter sp. Z1-5 TaxID=3134138 RepID=UPI0030C52631